ncbi:uncharacterized protein LOC131610265 isoform X2 [Vicia villosa]|uniref:uncharacterized protein LOC131610265 isoform X2 n=1 Tax=Vicia villosa TaxID=3911 RepID=UPI00273BD062|nr:uncharacterized protein LOC131610265 isoform X2 [Vicia villosa]
MCYLHRLVDCSCTFGNLVANRCLKNNDIIIHLLNWYSGFTVKGAFVARFAARDDLVLVLPERIQALPDGIPAAPKQNGCDCRRIGYFEKHGTRVLQFDRQVPLMDEIDTKCAKMIYKAILYLFLWYTHISCIFLRISSDFFINILVSFFIPLQRTICPI